MNKVFELLGVIAIDNKDANKNIDETGRKAKGLHSKMSQTFTNIGKGALSCGKFVAKGMMAISAAGAAAAAALLKSSIGAYAEYEQLQGGVKKLFGDDAAKTVMENAQKAFKTAGLSANEYMQTVTSFSASLISDLGKDTAAAAELSDMAIKDMADNANTFGTDISMIQNAYQGFAKDNYTMLDNLKLGYGGTKEEMARLINDSGVMGKTFKATAKNIDEVSFAKIIEAIHVVQGEMEITGTTANEASDTIEGSFNMWKASWSNLMTGMAGDENIEPLVDSFFGATQDVVSNIGKVLPKIGKNLKVAIASAGRLIDSGMESYVWPVIQDWFKLTFDIELPDWETFKTNVSAWWTTTSEKIGSICSWTMKYLGFAEWTDEDVAAAQAWWDGVYQKLVDICEWFLDPQLPDPETVINDIMSWWENVKKNLRLVLGITVQVQENYAGYSNAFSNAVDDVGNAVVQQTGSAEAGALAEQNMKTFTTNSDSNYDFGALVDWLFKPDSTNASGLRYVPRDGHIAKLHMGEMVLPRHEADAHRSGRDRGADISRLETAVNSLIALTRQLVANTAGGQTVVLDTGVLVGQMAPRMDAQLGTMTARKGRRG